MEDPKSLTRIYFPGEIRPDGTCVLDAGPAHHLTRVLRLEAGAAITLFDGRGVEWSAIITRIAKSGVTLEVGASRAIDRESPLKVTLAQAISGGERMDYTVQKAVELGVSGIQPLTSERSVVRLDSARAAKRVAHWQSITIAACEQCGRNRVPPVAPVMAFDRWLAQTPGGLRVLLAPGAESALRTLPVPAAGAVTLLAGPEGGFAPGEERAAIRAGCAPVRLGPRVLRTETAAVAALAALQTLWGDF